MNQKDIETLLMFENQGCEVAQEKREEVLRKGQERDARIAEIYKNYPTPEQIESEDRERHRQHEAGWDSVRMK